MRLGLLWPLLLCLAGVASAGEAERPIHEMWSWSDAPASEALFREAASSAAEAGQAVRAMSLRTQVARALGLQGRFDEAHAELDRIGAQLRGADPELSVRYRLERGRVLNSSGEPRTARPLFVEAWERAKAAGLDSLAVDAAHMVAIVETPELAVTWNERAIAHAEQAEDLGARRWLASLYNNLGWTHHEAGRHEQALGLFEKALVERASRGKNGSWRVARWAVARAKRSLGRLDEALLEQQALHTEAESEGREQDMYVLEELGECLYALGRQGEARPFFRAAWERMKDDPWHAAHEPDRVSRLAKLAGEASN